MFGVLCGLCFFVNLHCLAIVIHGLREKLQPLWDQNPGLAILFVVLFVVLICLGSMFTNFVNKATGRRPTSFWDNRPPRD